MPSASSPLAYTYGHLQNLHLHPVGIDPGFAVRPPSVADDWYVGTPRPDRRSHNIPLTFEAAGQLSPAPWDDELEVDAFELRKTSGKHNRVAYVPDGVVYQPSHPTASSTMFGAALPVDSDALYPAMSNLLWSSGEANDPMADGTDPNDDMFTTIQSAALPPLMPATPFDRAEPLPRTRNLAQRQALIRKSRDQLRRVSQFFGKQCDMIFVILTSVCVVRYEDTHAARDSVSRRWDCVDVLADT